MTAGVQGFPEAIWRPSPNFGYGSKPWNYGRVGRPEPIRQVIIHTGEIPTASRLINSLSKTTRVDSRGNRVFTSAHYVVDDNAVYQLVDDRNVAWHGGSPNVYSIGIEVVGYHDDPDTWSPEKVEQLGRLVGWLSSVYDIPLVYVGGALGVSDYSIPYSSYVAHGAYSASREDPGPYFDFGPVRQVALSYMDQTDGGEMMAGLIPGYMPQPSRYGPPGYDWEASEDADPPDEVVSNPSGGGNAPGTLTAGPPGGALALLALVAVALWFNR